MCTKRNPYVWGKFPLSEILAEAKAAKNENHLEIHGPKAGEGKTHIPHTKSRNISIFSI